MPVGHLHVHWKFSAWIHVHFMESREGHRESMVPKRVDTRLCMCACVHVCVQCGQSAHTCMSCLCIVQFSGDRAHRRFFRFQVVPGALLHNS
jgi:hypothetical protein